MRHRLAPTALTVLLLLGGAAQAGKREAAVRAKAGQKLLKDGNFIGALGEYLEAQREDGGWEYQFDIGVCESRLHHYAESLDAFEKYLRDGGQYLKKWQFDAVFKERDAVRKSTGEVRVTIEGPDADVSVDGEKVGKSPLTRPLVLAPGPHAIKASCDDCKAFEKTVDVVAGAQTSVLLKVVEKGKEPSVLDVTTEPDSAHVFVDGKPAGQAPVKHETVPGLHVVVAELDGHSPAEQEVRLAPGQTLPVALTLEPIVVVVERPFPVAGVVIGGAGLVAVISSIALYGSAQANKEEINKLFKAGGTWDAHAAEVDSARKGTAVFSGIFGVLGAAAIGTGLALVVLPILLPPPRPAAKAEPAPAEADPEKDGDKPAAPPEKDQSKPEEKAPESTLLLAPVPGGAMAVWTVTF